MAYAAGPGLIDTRVLGKPPTFHGKEQEYPEWHESFLSWAGLFNGVVAGHLELAKTHPTEIIFDQLPAEMQVMTQMVFHMFMQICRGRALTIIRRVPRRNGFEAFRRLHDRFYIKTDGKNIADLQHLMNPVWKKDGEEFEDDVEDWEKQLDDYERDSGELFPDNHKKAILMHNAPGQIKKHLYLNSSRMTSFAVVKHEVIQFLRSERSFENRSNRRKDRSGQKGDPMDIDEIGKGKKGKPKGGRKGGEM